ncbi:MAG: hypothetical protein ABGY96_00725 [bacterium]|nr:hypothetical protein [Gammaproteobacteria bacterium]HIL98506.1 hypothetical protein [Pseudomonadales bacterium]
MKIIRTILAVASAPVVYGILGAGLSSALLAIFPHLMNEQGGTYHLGVTLAVEAIQFLAVVLTGYISARIAGREEFLHCLAVVFVMLAIAIPTQVSFWQSMLPWHHFVFFMFCIIGPIWGTYLQQQRS